jgi:glycosyltransferase involved in cell wall biosynthesis/nucleotide-binding universal stress UspA family protein
MVKNRYTKSVFRKVLVPIIHGKDCSSALASASIIAGDGQVLLIGLVRVPEGESLSAAAVSAREVRQQLKQFSSVERYKVEEHVHASYIPWNELTRYAQVKRPDLLILEWPSDFDELCIPKDGLAHPPCDVAILSGPIPEKLRNVLISIRGGPHAELALQLSLALARNQKAKITSLHISPATSPAKQDFPFRNIDKVLIRLPEVNRQEVTTDDPVGTILEAAQQHDLVVMGASARPDGTSGPLGPVARTILQEGSSKVIVVKTKRPVPASFESETVGQSAISVLVDKWFAENTYHADEFKDLDALLDLKRARGLSISLALPALNEEETVGKVIKTVKRALMDSIPLLDEIVLIDSDSIDRTRDIARELDIPVFIHQQILPQYGARRGKGEALWKSLQVTHGDLILWIDTDIVNIQPHFVYGLIGPLLLMPQIQLVKGFYQRPLRVADKLQASGGGRVTELTARPLLNLLYPELSGLIQPLAGEYGGRRSALEKLHFSSGYGVEIGLLIDILETFGLGAIAQVDLQERIHHNQPLEALSKMSFTIIQTVFRKLERRYGYHFLEDMNRAMKLIRYESGRFFLEVDEIAEQDRPPMLDLPEYRERDLL